MKSYKSGGRGKVDYGKLSAAKEKKKMEEAPEATLDDWASASTPKESKREKPAKAAKESKDKEPDDSDVTRISVKYEHTKGRVPSHVFRVSPFKFKPLSFCTEAEQLNDKIYEADVQLDGLREFTEDPTQAMIYSVSGNPDDTKAKYFAAHLVRQHLQKVRVPNVVWNPIYGGFDNKLMDDDVQPPSMIVITNLTPLSTNLKLEKTRDLLEKFQNIPRIIVSTGMDPISFAFTKLFVPVHGIAYFCESLIKRKIEVI